MLMQGIFQCSWFKGSWRIRKYWKVLPIPVQYCKVYEIYILLEAVEKTSLEVVPEYWIPFRIEWIKVLVKLWSKLVTFGTNKKKSWGFFFLQQKCSGIIKMCLSFKYDVIKLHHIFGVKLVSSNIYIQGESVKKKTTWQAIDSTNSENIWENGICTVAVVRLDSVIVLTRHYLEQSL